MASIVKHTHYFAWILDRELLTATQISVTNLPEPRDQSIPMLFLGYSK
jgi:hypothetical protein